MFTVFLSAFLLFQVQLVFGKAILPWFGGTAAVWMTCLVFFQVLLLGGYAYASFVAQRLRPRTQGVVHLALLLASLLLLPIAPSDSWKPTDASDPTWRILGLLAVHLGGPFLVLSATGPLIQAWFARSHPSRSPYPLYALSNAGSLLGLLGYPFLVEPALTLPTQMKAWSAGYAVFVAFCGTWALRVAIAAPDGTRAQAESRGAPDAVTRAFWLGLSACGSAILLATTSRITQDVAPVPFLWVLPLALYLLSFVLCFEGRRWYSRAVVGWTLVASLFLVAAVHFGRMRLGLALQVSVAGLAQFACCMACHGELAASKPDPRHLTRFYLYVAAGGALGGCLVTLVAPLVFRTLLEYPLALAAGCVAWSAARRREAIAAAWNGRISGWRWLLGGAGALAVLALARSLEARGVLEASRNFYGVLQVTEEDPADPVRRWRRLAHGSTAHGAQFVDPLLRATPAAYYGPGSGIEACLRAARRARPGALRIGVVGMGAGSLAAYAGPGDALAFYEINPEVVVLARRWFTYWDDAEARGAKLSLELGDARLVLERELAAANREPFDVLVVDAFAGDAIPVHLLTSEAFELYRRRLAGDGLLAVHVSNLYLRLEPVVRMQVELLGWTASNFSSPPDRARACFANDWVAAAIDPGLLRELSKEEALIVPWPAVSLERVWTDDFSSLLPLLK